MSATKKGTDGHAARPKTQDSAKPTRKPSPGSLTKPAAEPAPGAERWLFAVVGAGDVAADTIRHTAERTRTLFAGGRKGAAETTSAAVDRLADRGRSVMGEVADSDGVRAVNQRAGNARKRLEALSGNLGKAAANAVEAGKAFRRAS